MSEEWFVLELPTSCAMLATARPSCMYFISHQVQHNNTVITAIKQIKKLECHLYLQL